MAKVKFTSVQLLLPIDDMTIEIPLTRGYAATVSAADSDLKSFLWFAQPPRNAGSTPYAYRGRLSTKLKMHNVVMERILGRSLRKGELVDHVDRNGLNNCRSNLRVASMSQNQANAGLRSDNTSGYKGVHKIRGGKKWAAAISVNGIKKFLGAFDTPELAYAAYCEAARRYFGEFARLE